MQRTGDVHLIQSVSRAIAILRCFDGVQELGVTDVSKRLGLHKSTTAGIMNTLKAENFLDQNEITGKYRLGLDLFRLAAGARLELNEICEPFLDELVKTTGETVNLAVRDDTQIVYVSKKESPHSMRISTSVGTRLPIYCTAIGKVMLAYMSREKALETLNISDLKPYTTNTITDMDKLLASLDDIRRIGVACDMEELEYGLICMGAPIQDHNGNVIAAISVSGPVTRMQQDKRENISKQILAASKAINRELYRTSAV